MLSFNGESGAEWLYDETARIGDRSGFGQVFRGTGPDGHEVAVKRVQLLWGDEWERRRREREVEIGRLLDSSPGDHLLPTIDVGRLNDDLLLVMPLAERSLAAALRAGDLDVAASLDAVRQIALGLVELAGVSVLHRDLKPANVLELEGRWHLADFGIARSLIESTGTYTFFGAGTWPYMARELWDLQPATVKTDLYALGVIAYEVLTGKRPFNGTDETTLRRQHRQDPAPPPTGVPAGVGRLMLRLLAKDPAQRPQDARAVVEALSSAIEPLAPRQEELRRAALEAEERRSRGEAKSAADAAARDAKQAASQGLRTQALADLAHILEDAADLAREALPELTFRGDGAQWHLAWEQARVTVKSWPDTPDVAAAAEAGFSHLAQARRTSLTRPVGGFSAAVDTDPIVWGIVYTAPPDDVPSANVICVKRGTQLVWLLLRFTPGLSRIGERAVGLGQGLFALQISDAPRARWQLKQTQLTPGAVFDLLREAIRAM